MNDHKHITDLHKEITEWKSEVEFVKDELKVFQNRIAEIASRNNSREVMADVEHFQNQAIRQQEVSDILHHDLRAKDHDYAEIVKSNPVASDRRLIDDHTVIRDQVVSYKKIYAEFKTEFNSFATKWM